MPSPVLRVLPRTLALVLACSALASCGNSLTADSSRGGSGGSAADPATLTTKAETTLPPGQSGFVSLAGQVQGQLTGDPADFGAHLDDQRALYWSFDAKPAVLGSKPGTPTSPKAGVQVYRDSYGVPIVYADAVKDLWYGVGYSIAQDRLFLMDAVRRMGQGNFAELTGCGGVPADLQQRTISYTAAEYARFFDAASQDAKDAVTGYVDGANAWLDEVSTNPSLLPAEYGLLTSTPAPFTVQDVLASGVFITRFVAAEGGQEWQNIALLKTLTERYGSARAGKNAFLDLTWLDDEKAAVSVPPSEGRFSNHPTPPQGRDAVFEQMADWAVTLPESIRRGDGTGHSTAPFPCSQPSLPGASNASMGLAGVARRALTGKSVIPGPDGSVRGQAAAGIQSAREVMTAAKPKQLDSRMRGNDKKESESPATNPAEHGRRPHRVARLSARRQLCLCARAPAHARSRHADGERPAAGLQLPAAAGGIRNPRRGLPRAR